MLTPKNAGTSRSRLLTVEPQKPINTVAAPKRNLRISSVNAKSFTSVGIRIISEENPPKNEAKARHPGFEGVRLSIAVRLIKSQVMYMLRTTKTSR